MASGDYKHQPEPALCRAGETSQQLDGVQSRISAIILQLQQCQGEIERGGDYTRALGTLITAHSDLGYLSTVIAESGKVPRYTPLPGPSGIQSMA